MSQSGLIRYFLMFDTTMTLLWPLVPEKLSSILISEQPMPFVALWVAATISRFAIREDSVCEKVRAMKISTLAASVQLKFCMSSTNCSTL